MGDIVIPEMGQVNPFMGFAHKYLSREKPYALEDGRKKTAYRGLARIPKLGLELGMEPIIEYLKRNLRSAGSSRWEAIATECGIAKTLPRKIAFNDRDNPGVQTIQPLIDFFQAVDRGEKSLPEKRITTSHPA